MNRQSGEQTLDDVSLHVRQAHIEALEFDRERFVVDAEEVQEGRVQIVHMDDVLNRVVAEFVRCAISET